jgi:23S rRNA pseudouridine2604 synthase
MCEHLDYRVKKLKRIRIMNVHLDLPSGKWRDLTTEELQQINILVDDSSKTNESEK